MLLYLNNYTNVLLGRLNDNSLCKKSYFNHFIYDANYYMQNETDMS